MRHESIETTMRYYVGVNAEATADELWSAPGYIPGTRLAEAGLEPNAEVQAILAISVAPGTESGTVDADLAEVVEAWPTLDDETRRRIVALVRGVGVGAANPYP